jgi:hypothetical protein
MLRNVLDIDLAAQKISIRSRSGAILLFDFTAAFPSLAHDMIWDTLEVAGIDIAFINVVKMFYNDNKHLLKLNGSTFNGVHVRSGVRQGCPLSGLLFAICVDVFLSRLQKHLHGSEVAGAFADDIAIVVEDFWRSAPTLQRLFSDFQEISALTLNVKKTVMIPLWPFSCARNLRTLIQEVCAQWADFAIDGKGKYLGFLLGPGAGPERWTGAVAKFEQRVKYWANLHLGMAMNVVAFNIYIAPVLEFSAQLFEVDGEVLEKVRWALRRLASGPGTWAIQQDLENLKLFGFRAEFKSLEHTAQAAKLRVITTVAQDYYAKGRELDEVKMEHLRRPFGTWHERCYYKVLQKCKDDLANAGLRIENIRHLAAPAGAMEKERGFQSAVTDIIKAKLAPYNAEDRIRRKVKRWRFHDPPAHVANRILANIKTIGQKCRPCVVAMFFRTIWNGWPTTARMRNIPGAKGTSKCVLGCSQTAEDRIEHYLLCPKAWSVLQKPRPHGAGFVEAQRCLQTMLLAQKGLDDSDKCCIAIAVYAISRTVQTMRSHPHLREPERLISLFWKDGCSGGKLHNFTGFVWYFPPLRFSNNFILDNIFYTDCSLFRAAS